MTPHQSLAIAVRLFAIWFALYVARESLAFYAASREQDDPYSAAIVSIVIVVAVSFLIVLWFFPKTIARGILPLSADTPAKSSSPETWIAAGSSLIGLWLVASAVPALLRNGLVMFLFRSESLALDKSGLVSGLLYYAIQCAVGVALIVGANGVRKFISWARYAGSD
jgi:hypothetical protein